MAVTFRFLLSITVYLVLFFAASYLLQQQLFFGIKVLTMLSYAAVLTLLNFLLLKDMVDIRKYYHLNWKYIAISLLAAMLIVFAPYLLVHQTLPNWNNLSAKIIAGILFSQTGVAYAEESLFRVFIFLLLYKQLKQFWMPAIITSVLFALIHFQVYDLVTYWYIHVSIFCISMLLCFVMATQKSVLPCVVFHFMVNVCSSLGNPLDHTYTFDPADKISAFILLPFMMLILWGFKNKIRESGLSNLKSPDLMPKT
jgi:membrane protease YdiL (CAAX protease family)